MVRWSMTSECLALILIVIIMLFFHDKRMTVSYQRRLFRACLWLSLSSILLNALCVYTLEMIPGPPIAVNLLLNSAYFFISVLMCTAVAVYLFHRILEYVYDKRCLRRAMAGLRMVMGAYAVLVLWNLYSGVLFYFDARGGYRRGPLNRAGYLVMLVELAMLLACYVRNRKSVSKTMKRVMNTTPPIVVLLALFQLAYPDLLLNGTIIAMADLIIFISFQSRPVERDSLTGVGNRNSFFDELTLRTAGRQRFQVVVVALKNFALINQKFGYSSGDALLYQVANYLDGLCRDSRAFRFSSVEFAVLLPCWDDGADSLAQIRARFQEDWTLGETRAHLSCYTVELNGGEREWAPGQVIDCLEYALDLAKREGRPLVRFDGETARGYQRRLFLVQTMEEAIRGQRFQVWYQPVYHRDSGRFASAEALLRLADPQGTPVSPGEFIPIAEETGMIDALSWIVLEEVCRLLGSGRAPGLEEVSLNLSMQQLLERDLPQRLERSLERHHVEPGRLKLEITERVLLDDEVYVRGVMERLAEHRLRFFLDDFGTGYSNFSSVLDLPFEAIKLNRSLLSGLSDNPRAQLMATTLIPFFHSLGQTVVAEGIETQDQARRVLEYGADRIQGFYYARPMTQDALIALFQGQEHQGTAD